MERQDVRQDYSHHQQPASKNTRAKSFLQSANDQSSTSDEVRALAREVLIMNQQMRNQDMPYVLQLHNTAYGPDMLVIDRITGLPCEKLAYDLINTLATLPRDG